MRARKMHADEVDIDAGLVRRLLTTQFPKWADLPIEYFDSGGTVNAIYRLGDEMYVRLPLVETWAWHLKVEAKWVPKFAPHVPVAVPEVLAAGVPGEGYPFRWAVYRWLEGETWSTERIRDLREAAGDLARFITALERIDTSGVQRRSDALDVPLSAIDEWVRGSIERSRDMIDTDAVTTAWETALEAPGFQDAPVWVHSDIGPGNLLVRGGRLSAVIDWGAVHVGDPAHDLAAAWSLFSGDSRAVFRAALEVDDGTWARARGWAIRAVGGIWYYRETNRAMVQDALNTIAEVLADVSADP